MSDELINDLLAVPEPPERTPRRMEHPKGWEPGVAWDPTTGSGEIVVQSDRDPDPAIWDHLIADWGLDPTRCTVVPGSVQIRAWDMNVGDGEIKRMKYYRATIVGRTASVDRPDVEALCAEIMKRKPRKPVTVEYDRALIVCLSDWQLGKGESDGSAGTVDRILAARDQLVERIKELNLAPRIVLAAVPGNHGENRKDGKSFTNVATDNDDLTTVETVGEILAANPERYGHISVVLAQDYTLALDVCGMVVAWNHGHTARKSGHAAAVMEDWWRGQVMGRQTISDADILVTGHRHHLVISESTGRTFLQCPAMDPGSAWYTASTGNHSPSGMLTFCVGRESYPTRGWGDLCVL
jgi:predicted phosphodiesterase